MPAVGKAAPAFTLDTDTGERLSLRDLKGKPVVLYFYPKDDTSGCTAEACEFRDAFPRFDKSKAVILGVSPDPVKSHQKFKAKYELPFTLLADTDHAVAEQYGVWKEKSMYGRKYMGVDRTTFIIDAAGKIAKIFE
jgi:peroxiredoxin Q/BCP